ncbi:MAG TPA: L-seryl-tRNA(Sec) selenium transferase [Egibacteraceae bacterium]|nr:L-seryl-tRNA(Sec) selenium transferase [Egibacteraceae bacterium]
MTAADRSELAALPRIDALVDASADLVARYGRPATTAALRRAVEAARAALLAGRPGVPGPDDLAAAAAAELAARRPGPPRPVINAAGVVVHTNLGRAPLSQAARQAMLDAAGYCDLEYDLAGGVRGSRGARLDPLLAEATGAQAGTAVNNAAAALVLVLTALAGGRDVLVSRGELVEIGGSFRLPEIMAASGARLVEVGTTNRTRASDYAPGGPGADVALILKVHPSNYRITGFTAEPTVAELAAVARAREVPLVHDVGSGLLGHRPEPWLHDEPTVRVSLEAGADLVLCSGDKLLGGPQAGLLVGRSDLVALCRRHPLARALRLDKLRVAALVATLESHLRDALDELPIWAMLHDDPAQLRRRAEALAAAVGGEVVDGATLIGGGAVPGHDLPSPLVRLRCPSPDAVARRLRQGHPPVVARVDDAAVWFDLRTVDRADDSVLVRCLADALGPQEARQHPQ